MAFPNITIGTYGTTNDYTKVGIGASNSAYFSVGARTSAEPQVVTGLNMLDMGNTSVNKYALRVISSAEPDSTATEQFKIQISSWADTLLYNARVSWFKLAAEETSIQCGVFDTKKAGKFSDTIKFPRSFAAAPVVFVGLSGFDLKGDWYINLTAKNITKDQFIITIGTGSNSTLTSATATWIAIPKDKHGVMTGPMDVDGTDLQWNEWNEVRFAHAYDRTPTVFTALTSFDVDQPKNLRVKLNTEASEEKLRWKIEKWSDTGIRSIRSAYLIIAL
jgi:hypothetical protein